MNFLARVSVPAILILTTTSCIKQEPVYESPNTNRNEPAHRIDFTLDATAEYVQDIRDKLGTVSVAEDVLSYQADASTTPELREALGNMNEGMTDMGFDNFNRSGVNAVNGQVFYSVLRSDQNTSGNRVMCTAFMKDDGSEAIAVLDGPVTTGLGIALSVAGEDYNTDQLQAMFLPVERLSSGNGDFAY